MRIFYGLCAVKVDNQFAEFFIMYEAAVTTLQELFKFELFAPMLNQARFKLIKVEKT